MNPFKFITDLIAFFSEVAKASRADDYQFTANTNWWLTKSVIAHEEETGNQANSACAFFWTAILLRPLSRLTNFVGRGDQDKGFVALLVMMVIILGTLFTQSVDGFIFSVFVAIVILLAIALGSYEAKREKAQNKTQEPRQQTTLREDFDNWREKLIHITWWKKPFVLVDGLVKGLVFAMLVAVFAPIYLVIVMPLIWVFNLLKANYCPMVFYSQED